MRQFVISYPILLSLLSSLIPSESQTQQEFCSVSHFDGVFYIGTDLHLKFSQWYWKFDKTYQKMMPYVFSDSANIVTTTLFINRVPPCNDKDCDKKMKALDLLFIRKAGINTYQAKTVVERIINDRMVSVAPADYPWSLTDPHTIWPNDWDLEPSVPKPALFYPPSNVVFFITERLNIKELHSNTITSIDWYKNMSSKRLSMTGVHFVGLFHTSIGYTGGIKPSLQSDSVYAVGHHINDSTQTSKLFYLSPHDFQFLSEPKDLRIAFGCSQIAEPIRTDSPQTKGEGTKGENTSDKDPDPGDGTGLAYIIIIVVIIFVCIIAIAVAILIYVKVKDSPTDANEPQPKNDSNNSTKTKDTDNSTRVSSIETIDSHTGVVIK